MKEQNSFFTYIEKELNGGKFKGYKLHFIIELNGYKPVLDPKTKKFMSIDSKSPGTPVLDGPDYDYKLKNLKDLEPNECIIHLNTVGKKGHHETIEGSIEIKDKEGGGTFGVKPKWHQIAVTLKHAHSAVTHDGTSTSHLGDGD